MSLLRKGWLDLVVSRCPQYSLARLLKAYPGNISSSKGPLFGVSAAFVNQQWRSSLSSEECAEGKGSRIIINRFCRGGEQFIQGGESQRHFSSFIQDEETR